MATYDGVNLFGNSVRCRMEVNPSASQINEFFGISGRQALFGGSRGRTFFIEGIFVAPDAPTLSTAINLMLSYDDGIGRTFTDSFGVAYPSVVFRRFMPAERILPGPCLAYKAQFDGLI